MDAVQLGWKYIVFKFDYGRLYKAKERLHEHQNRAPLECTAEEYKAENIQHVLKNGIPLSENDPEKEFETVDYCLDEDNLNRIIATTAMANQGKNVVIYVIQVPEEYLTGLSRDGGKMGCIPIVRRVVDIDTGVNNYVTPHLIRGYVDCSGHDLGINENEKYNPAFDCRGLHYTEPQKKEMKKRSPFWESWISVREGLTGEAAIIHAGDIFGSSHPRRLKWLKLYQNTRASQKRHLKKHLY